MLVIPGGESEDDYRPLCAPELAYSKSDLDMQDTGVVCPDCHDVALDMEAVLRLPPALEDLSPRRASA